MTTIERLIRDYQDLADNYADNEQSRKHYLSVIQGIKLAEQRLKLDRIRGIDSFPNEKKLAWQKWLVMLY